MTKFSVTVGGKTIEMTMDDLRSIETAALAATKKPGKAISHGRAVVTLKATGNGAAQMFSQTEADPVLTQF